MDPLKGPLQAEQQKIPVRQGLAERRTKEGAEGQIDFPHRQIGRGNADLEIAGSRIFRIVGAGIAHKVEAQTDKRADVQIRQELEIMGLKNTADTGGKISAAGLQCGTV